MKIKLDESMPSALAELLRFRGHDVATVPEEQLSGAEDSVVVARATKKDRLLMTFDHDFGDIRSYPIRMHSGVVMFRLRDQRWAVLKDSVERLLASGVLDRVKLGLAIVDEDRIRIRSKERS
jgi:predicted nuclease of predicted toxin-antitoxin system